MKLRNLLVVLACAAACKQSHDAPRPRPVPPVAPAAPAGSADPWSKPAAAQAAPLARPLFWSIEKDGKTSYAFGTMHMGVDPLTRIPQFVWQRFGEAKTFAMETDLSQSSKLDITLPSDRSLRAELGEKYWQKFVAVLGEGDAERYNHFKPMIPATVLSMRGLPQTAPMDGVLLGRAINQKKQLVYLESIDREASVLEKWMTVRALQEMLDDLDDGEQHSKEMLAAYVEGDDTKLLQLSETERTEWKKHGRSDREYDEQMDDLLYKRNASWIEPIEKLHASGGGFIAVGAMHLIGKRSVLDLLQQKGYKVTRITS